MKVDGRVFTEEVRFEKKKKQRSRVQVYNFINVINIMVVVFTVVHHQR